MLLRLFILLMKKHQRKTAIVLIILCLLYVGLRFTYGIPADVQAVITLLSIVLGSIF